MVTPTRRSFPVAPTSSSCVREDTSLIDPPATGTGMTGATTGTGMTDTTTGSTNYGPHSSNLANKADPRIDSDMGKLNAQT